MSNLLFLMGSNAFFKFDESCDAETIGEWLQGLADTAERIKLGEKLDIDGAKKDFICSEPKTVKGKLDCDKRSEEELAMVEMMDRMTF